MIEKPQLGKWGEFKNPQLWLDEDMVDDINNSFACGVVFVNDDSSWRVELEVAWGDHDVHPFARLGSGKRELLHKVIHGVGAFDASVWSLFAPYSVGSSMVMGAVTSSPEIWDGWWFAKSSNAAMWPDTVSEKVWIHFGFLDEWARGWRGRAGLERVMDEAHNRLTEIALPETAEWLWDRGPDERLNMTRSPSWSVDRNHASVSMDTVFHLVTQEPLAGFWDNWIIPIQSALTILMGMQPRHTKTICELAPWDGWKKVYRPSADVYYHQSGGERDVDPQDMISLVALEAVGVPFADLWGNHFRLWDTQHGQTFVKNVAAAVGSPTWDSNNYFSMCCGLERFADLRGHSQIGQRQKLEYSLEKYPGRYPDNFEKTVVELRQRLGHVGILDEKWTDKMYGSYETLRMVLRGLYLLELGVPDADIADLVKRGFGEDG